MPHDHDAGHQQCLKAGARNMTLTLGPVRVPAAGHRGALGDVAGPPDELHSHDLDYAVYDSSQLQQCKVSLDNLNLTGHLHTSEENKLTKIDAEAPQAT